MASEYKIRDTDIVKWNNNNVICHKNPDSTTPAWLEGQFVQTNDMVYFSAKAGYKIQDPPYAEFSNGTKLYFKEIGSTGVWSYKTVSSSSYGFSRGFTATAVADVPILPIRYTFTNADVQGFAAKKVGAFVDDVAVVVGSVLREGQTLKLTTSKGFKFEYAQVSTDLGMVEVMTPNESKTVMTYTAIDENLQDIMYDTEDDPVIVCTITDSLLQSILASGVVGYVNDEPMTLDMNIFTGDVISFKVANPTLQINSARIRYSGISLVMNISEDLQTASYQWDSWDAITGFTISTSKNPNIVYEFDSEKLQYFTDRHAKCYVDDVLMGEDGIIYNNQTIRIECDAGYEFLTGEPVRIDSSIIIDMVLNENRTVATTLYDTGMDIYSFNFITTKTAVVETDTSNNTYEITPRELRNLESLNLKEFNVEGVQIADYSNLLVGVMRYPFTIPDEYKGSEGGIYLGHKQYDEVKAKDVSVDVLEIDLGTIEIDNTYNDLRDYANTEAILRLPHLDSVSLDLEYVIGQTVGVKYIVNLINGETTVIITSSKLPQGNDTLLTLKATIGTPIPIAHKEGFNYQPIDAQGLRLGGINHIESPTIDIVRNVQVNGDSMFTIPVKDSGTLTDFNGWTKIDDIVLTVNATQQEKQEIISLLKSGVFFNE